MKTPGPTKAEPSAPNSANSTVEDQKLAGLTPRQIRVLEALLQTRYWVSRESVDRIAGASNGPQVVLELRRKVTGHDGIKMERTEATDRDGKSCRPGRYQLTSKGRKLALKAISKTEVA